MQNFIRQSKIIRILKKKFYLKILFTKTNSDLTMRLNPLVIFILHSFENSTLYKIVGKALTSQTL